MATFDLITSCHGWLWWLAARVGGSGVLLRHGGEEQVDSLEKIVLVQLAVDQSLHS